MTLTAGPSPLDGRVAATDLDRALGLLHEAERARSEAAGLLAGLQHTELERFHGYVSWERLVAHQAGCGNRDARRLLLVARHLDRFSLTTAALESGMISAVAAEVLARAAVGLTDAYEESETDLLAAAERCEVEELERICRLWRDRADDEAAAEDAEHRFNQRGVWIQPAFDGSSRGRFSLGSIETDIFTKALETQPDSDTSSLAEPRTLAQRRADRLIDICQDEIAEHPTTGTNNETTDSGASNKAGGTGSPDGGVSSQPDGSGTPGGVSSEPGGSATPDDEASDASGGGSGSEDPTRRYGAGLRATVDVVIDVETLAGADADLDRIRAELSNGAPITGPGLERLLCDASYRALITDGPRTVLAYNRATPDIPGGLRRAVRIRDRHCQFHGCDRPWHWCDLHHLIPRSQGGPTTIENLALTCRFHHGLVHEGGWQLTRAPDGTIQTTSP